MALASGANPLQKEMTMTQLPQDSDAWRRAGADRKPPASGEQIDRDPQSEPIEGGPSLQPDASGQERAAPDEERPPPDTVDRAREDRPGSIGPDSA